MTTLAQITADIELYSTYDDPDFIAEIPRFIKSSEEKIWYIVGNLPTMQRSVTGNFTASNPYLQLPADFLACASLATISALGVFTYLLPKDVSYIRECYPNPATTGNPIVYSLFSAGSGDTTILVAPTPSLSYSSELNYFYKPASLVDEPTGTWLSINAYNALLYGALAESALYLKDAAGIDSMGDKYEKQFVVALQALKNLAETRDKMDTYRNSEQRRVAN